MCEPAVEAVNHNLTWHRLLPRDERWRSLGQRPAVAWLTGLSGAGKSSIANVVDRALIQCGCHTMVIDGDNLRQGLNRDLSFSTADRAENVRRAAETARLMADAGLVVIVSLISPFREERAMARRIAGDIPFFKRQPELTPSRHEDLTPMPVSSPRRAWGWGR
ncbi:adenylyl-sulfate kinase [Methylobacterium fujisawaense]|uniref:adenylyl-sulfate kinase n=1 Tax=Methylobacterium fujisawaense TaxID=107400 RepID=UPI0031F53731